MCFFRQFLVNLPLLLLLAALWAAAPARAEEADTVKVFLLAGQSNMEGKAPNKLLDHQATDPETASLFTHLRRDGEWVVRDDAFIKFLNRRGGLTIGYGSPGRTGMELEFGHRMAEHFSEPVLLIKAAWGGHSLVKNFRPPSAGLPSEESLQAELEQAQKRVRENNEKNNRNQPLPTMEQIREAYGASYRQMLAEVREVRENLDTLFPELKGKKLEMAGMVWFQGWNDMYGGEDSYAENLKHLIQDVRRDLEAPALPVVVAAMGQNGSQPAKGAMLIVQEAQLSMNEAPEFRGNVKAFRTDVLIDKAAEELFPEWRERREEWDRTGGDFPYHYLGSAIWFQRIGGAAADCMLELLKQRG